MGLIIGAVGSGQLASRMGRYKILMLIGLMTAALTDSCVMGALLSRLPYNRDAEPDVRAVVDALRRRTA